MFTLIRMPFTILTLSVYTAFFSFNSKKTGSTSEKASSETTISASIISPSNLFSEIPVKYAVWNLEKAGIGFELFSYAMKGYENLLKQDKLSNQEVITIVDFSKPSSEKRLYVLALNNGKILFNTLVAHGRNSGELYATSFSNSCSSFESSPGFYVTEETYMGKHGYSLKLDGCEKRINDNAYDRGIVIHGADYVSESFVKQNGFLGRSQGCPAVPSSISKKIISTIKNGSCLFVYTPSKKYLKKSALLNS